MRIKWSIVSLVLMTVILSACGAETPEVNLPDTNLPPEAALEAQAFLSEAINVAQENIEFVNVEQVDWPDSCLGLGGPEESCAAVITPGWRVILAVDGTQHEVRTNEDASVVRLQQDG